MLPPSNGFPASSLPQGHFAFSSRNAGQVFARRNLNGPYSPRAHSVLTRSDSKSSRLSHAEPANSHVFLTFFSRLSHAPCLHSSSNEHRRPAVRRGPGPQKGTDLP